MSHNIVQSPGLAGRCCLPSPPNVPADFDRRKGGAADAPPSSARFCLDFDLPRKPPAGRPPVPLLIFSLEALIRCLEPDLYLDLINAFDRDDFQLTTNLI